MRFREFETSSGKKIICGKDAESNEELVKQFMGNENKMFHTAAPGSPFCIIDSEKASKKDMKEAVIFCASKSQDWRDNKQNVIVHAFSGKEVYKKKGMKVGMFGVGDFEEITAKKKDIEKQEKLLK